MASETVEVLKFFDLNDTSTCTRVCLESPLSVQSLTTRDLQNHAQEALVSQGPPSLFFREDGEDGDYVALVGDRPFTSFGRSCLCLVKKTLRIFYKLQVLPAPPALVPPATSSCMGPHLHQPTQKQLKAMSYEEWQGRCFHAAAADGCLSCVRYWLDEQDVSVAWKSPNAGYTAMDWVEYELTRSAGGPVRQQSLLACKACLEIRQR